MAQQITDAINCAASFSIPKSKGIGKRNKPFWNDECQNAVKDRNAVKKKASKKFDLNIFVEYKKKRAMATKILKKAKRSYWHNFCSSLNKHSKLSKVWKIIKGINNVQGDTSF